MKTVFQSHPPCAGIAAHTRVQSRLRRQSDLIQTLVRSLLLDPASSEQCGLRVETLVVAAEQDTLVGGDFSDAFPISKTVTAVVVGDIMGKGLSAARSIPQVKYALRAFLDDDPNLVMAITRLNRFLCAMDASGRFCALSVALINHTTGQCQCVSAGSEPAIIVRQNGRLESVLTFNVPIGIEMDYIFRADHVMLEMGDILFMTTDGLTEARRGPEMLGPDGLGRILHTALPSDDLAQVARVIVDSARQFAQGKFHDDVCLLMAQRR